MGTGPARAPSLSQLCAVAGRRRVWPRHVLRSPGLVKGARAELLHVLMLPDFERADGIGELWSYPESRAFAELLIDRAEDRTLRGVQVGMLR